MEEFIIEYHFGVGDPVKRIVESESDDMEVVLSNNISDTILFTDERNKCSYAFNYSNVKYMKIKQRFNPE